MESQKYIIWEKINSTGILSINLPPENYLKDPEFIKINELNDLITSNKIKGIIIRGMGRHFSAGADIETLKALAKNENSFINEMTKGVQLLDYIENLEIPVIAAINGVCFGGGMEIALACDIRICGENAIFAFPEINRGLIPGLGGLQRLTGFLGKSRAKLFVLGGNVINAETALTYNIVDEVLPSKEVFDYSIELMQRMTKDKDLDVIHAVMRSINNYGKLPFEIAIKEETKLFCQLALKLIKHNK